SFPARPSSLTKESDVSHKSVHKVKMERKPKKRIWVVTIEDEYSAHRYELEGPDDISVHTVMALLKLDLLRLLK
ncbi:MAG: hypothetical protein AABY22_27165, partial [Nanoarchaeota archaeon]